MKRKALFFLLVLVAGSVFSQSDVVDVSVQVALPEAIRISPERIGAAFISWAQEEYEKIVADDQFDLSYFVELDPENPIPFSIDVWVDDDARLRVHIVQDNFHPYPHTPGIWNYYYLPGESVSNRDRAELVASIIEWRARIVTRSIYNQFRELGSVDTRRAATSLTTIVAYDLRKDSGDFLRYMFMGRIPELSGRGSYYLSENSELELIEGDYHVDANGGVYFYPDPFRDPIFGTVNETSIRLAEFFEREVP